MNREEYTQLMIDKSKTLARDDMNVVDRIVNKINGKKIRTNEEFANLLIEECFKQDGIRPEFFLDTTQTASQRVLNTLEKQEAFAKRIVEFQQAEAVVHEMMVTGNIQELQANGTISLYKESMKFNPTKTNDYYQNVDNSNDFVVGEAPKTVEYTDKFTLFSQEPIQNEQSILIKPLRTDSEQNQTHEQVSHVRSEQVSEVNEVHEVDAVVDEVKNDEYTTNPIQENEQNVMDFEKFMEELNRKYDEKYAIQKVNKTGLKSRLVNENTGGVITIEKSILGTTTVTAGTGTPADDLATMLLKGDGRLVQVPQPPNDTDFANMVEAWKKLQADGYDLDNIKLVGKEPMIPDRYRDALEQLKNPGFVLGGQELDGGEGQEPKQPENEGQEQEPNQPENEGQEQEPNQPENEGEGQEPNEPENEGEEQEPNEPENEGETPEEPKQQEQQVDDNPFEGENAVNEAEQPENEIVEDHPFDNIDYDNIEFDDEDVENNANQEQDFDPDFDDALVDAVNGIDPNSDDAVEQRAIQELQVETGTNQQNSHKTHQKQAKRAKLR
ncbi:hypothetical protein NB559_12785 [Vibrio parahaemolyticus]|uniref:hypothetical protein n=1 Tax=Vibrio parahaemolyticus TaxID=670 RepID=UPI001B8265C1|nr:hypothetical protein [Vibrio parahaemolyticus]EJE4157348.1 hypothetical protein [Vibrio parahaemolyticus]MCR9650723.1 hypothetical protein [Vibrio parahaemolyticus]MCR9806355.1 hypothetical protein [Vibrio parahaemolyticus]HBC3821551.1 hypothetical protein [Vibrio parahaemolyticus]